MTLQPDRKLPPGWRWARLGELCELNPHRPGNLERPDNSPTTFVPMSTVDERLGKIVSPELRPYSALKKGYTYFEEGDILFAKITPCMQNGKHAIARNLVDGLGFGTTEFHVLRPGSQVVPEWVHYYIRQPWMLEEATAHFTGSAGQQRVPDSYLTALEIPLPPLAEQKRIAAILSEQMAVVERARAATEAQLEAAKALPAAHLRAVFDTPEAHHWPKRAIGDLAETCSGTTPPRARQDYYAGRIPWVKTGELRDGVVDDTEEHVSEEAVNETSLRLLPPGTLLVAMYGQGQTRGRTGILSTPATINQACFAVLPRPGEFDTTFLQCWFRYSYWRLRQDSEGRGGNQPNLSGDVLRNQLVPLPPFPEQVRIASCLSDEMAAVERAHEALEAQLNSINALPAALLRRAFSGEL